MNKDLIVVEGEVFESLPNAAFRVRLDENSKEILCQLSGKMRMNRIKVITGDRVKVALTPYDENRGRIVYRMK